MWVKILGVILIGTIALGFISDLVVIDHVYSKGGRSIEHSIDAGIIKSGIVEDAQQGIVRLNESELKDATEAEFRHNMDLDSKLENKIMKNSQFNLQLTYVDGIPWIEVEFRTHVSFTLPFIKYPITIRRKIAFESTYK